MNKRKSEIFVVACSGDVFLRGKSCVLVACSGDVFFFLVLFLFIPNYRIKAIISKIQLLRKDKKIKQEMEIEAPIWTKKRKRDDDEEEEDDDEGDETEVDVDVDADVSHSDIQDDQKRDVNASLYGLMLNTKPKDGLNGIRNIVMDYLDLGGQVSVDSLSQRDLCGYFLPNFPRAAKYVHLNRSIDILEKHAASLGDDKLEHEIKMFGFKLLCCDCGKKPRISPNRTFGKEVSHLCNDCYKREKDVMTFNEARKLLGNGFRSKHIEPEHRTTLVEFSTSRMFFLAEAVRRLKRNQIKIKNKKLRNKN
jgi:hypothetical protein